MTQRLPATALLSLILSSLQAVQASPAPAAHEQTRWSNTQHSQLMLSEDVQARAWGLQASDWVRYRELMQGPLGIYAPHLDPLTALGIEARSDEERARYAELQVRAEARRVEKLLTYQRAYDAAWQRLAPDLQRVTLEDANVADEARLSVFVKADCPPCLERVRQLQAQGRAFDLYLVDSKGDDARLRRWARQARLDPMRVQQRTITLNHDNGRFQSLGLAGELPVVAQRMNGQWQRQ
ncbi:TIGR03759 family integrating conjugative element protein [Pseudomonas sp. AS2.8]|uniref:TIGR03759 family integrating conjugative element protein n=1 Tax=Pseudomonas sp. AS2.8 TaxID=2587128 RepID=UPI00160DC918|nr:TIGR03759 family integrating conjugative element protein [Pseudomonas sp. AS2.8]MBB2897781.1 integrating conjugative element protein (TIGR03759 family) [Pseudomonas sp. AS2.8]